MASARVFVSGAPGDALLEWLCARLQTSGYDPLVLAPAGEAADAALISLAPVVAGFDLWRTAGEERFEALAALDERLPPGRPLLALCNALSADEAASYTVHAERVVGFSLFGILREGMLAEVLPGLGTEAGAVQRAVAVLAALGLQTETLPPGSWAVYPRVIAMVVNEAAVAIAEGVASAADIDTAMTLGANYPQGPLALADEIGLGEILAVLEALHAEYGDDRYRPAPLLRRLVLAGYTGRAVGRGFHSYS
jgi:3-hydroxybutyryl-CoA dehydrogenase